MIVKFVYCSEEREA